MSKASLESLEDLHGALAQSLADTIKNGEEVITKEGEVVTKRASASILNVARQLLKDNQIESGVGNADMSDLEKAMGEMNNLPYDGEVPAEYKN